MFKFNRYELGYKLLIVYIYILLFGSWVLRLIGFPESSGLPLIAAFDVMPLGIWILSNPSFRIRTREVFVDTFSFWLLWLIVLTLIILTSIRVGGSVVPALVQWGVMIRYIPLACIVVALGKHIDIGARIIRQFKILATILIVIGYLCVLLREKASIFLPYIPSGATGIRELSEGNYSTIFANTIDYAFILVLLYTIFVYRQMLTKVKVALLTLVFLIPVFKTGSAIAVAVFLFIAFFRLSQGQKFVRFSVISLFICAVATFGYTYWDLVMLVVDDAKLSRLGLLTLTAPDFISEFSVDTLLGMGSDGHVVLNKINGYKEQVYLMEYATNGNITAFGDVYWVALLVFHGLIGLSIIIYLFYSLFKVISGKEYIDSKFDYNRIIKWFFFSVIIFAFLNQVIVVKTFALVFWIFLAIVYNNIRKDESITN